MDLENRTVMKIRLHFEVSYKDVIFFKYVAEVRSTAVCILNDITC